MLKRLEIKGFVVREASERGFVYAPSVSDKTARKSALSPVVRVFFNGSATSAAAALLGMQDEMPGDELDELEKMIAQIGRANVLTPVNKAPLLYSLRLDK